MDFKNLTIREIHQSLLNKDFSSLDLTNHYFENIEKKDKEVQAFLTLTKNEALSQAKAVDEKIRQGEKITFLSGVPAAIKDNIVINSVKTTAGSKILENYFPPYDAYVIKKLKEENFVLLGRTNLDEFAMGSSTENSAFFITKNPLDLKRVPGGSSGGSAAAVAADECVYALGSDTGGSIRQPAAFCGLVGLKPSYGRVSRWGLISLTSSTDVIGCLTKNVSDAALILESIAGFDEKDSTSQDIKVEKYLENIERKPENIRVGKPKEYFTSELNKEIEKGLERIFKKLGRKNIEVVDISLPHTDYSVVTYYIITPSEASSNLARYDGVRYGFSQVSKSSNMLKSYLSSRGLGLGREPKRRIMLGTFSLSQGYYDAYYLRALKVRNLISQDFKEAFKKVDFILTPTTPNTAFKIGQKTSPLDMYLSDVFLTASSLAGLPALALPFWGEDKLPYSLQIISDHFQEKKLLNFGYFLESLIVPDLDED